MAEGRIHFKVTFEDFKFLQGYMARRVYVRRGMHGRALLSVVACATFIALAIVINLRPNRGNR
jgi:hypothetical protein